MYMVFAVASIIMIVLPPKGPAACSLPVPVLVVSMRILGIAKYILPVIWTLLFADVVEESAENGCGPWKANADETDKTTRAQMASLAQINCFTILSPQILGSTTGLYHRTNQKNQATPNTWRSFTLVKFRHGN
jgi:hypothetical protein